MGEPKIGRQKFEDLYHRLDEAEQRLTRDAQLDPAAREKILADRTRAVAEARTERGSVGLEVLAFRVGGERYAVPIAQVDEVLEIRGLFPLLGAPRHVLGAVVARSRLVPVLDLRQLLGLEGGGMSDLTKVAVVGQGEELFGLAIEDVEGRLELGDVKAGLSHGGPFQYVGPDRLAVLDLEKLGEPRAASV